MTRSAQQLELAALHVGFAMRMACVLPPHSDDSAYIGEVQAACLESYMSNMRLLIEFLTRSRDRRDIHRHDYLPGWDPTGQPTLQRLNELWTTVSQDVSHLSWERVPQPGKEFVLQNVTPKNLTILATLMLDVVDEFTQALKTQRHPNVTQFRAALDYARTRL